MLEEPIILLGTHRSGTTWLGRAFSEGGGLAYWKEPRQLWMWGHWFQGHDRLTEHEATPRVRNEIRRRVERFVSAHGASRLVEKTPSNCLRLPFIRAVFPRAKMVMILRDGRSVIRSTGEMMDVGLDWARIGERIRETPLTDWPAFARDLGRFARGLLGRPPRIWGPRPPGWTAWARSDSRHVLLAKQWSATVRQAVEDGRRMDAESYLEVRYEDLTDSPVDQIERILDFADVRERSEIVEYVARTADPSRRSSWKRELTQECLREIRPHMEPTLRELGYEW